MTSPSLRPKSRFKHLLINFAAIIVVVTSGCQGKMLRQHPDFIARPSQIRTIAVLEPRLDIVTTSFFNEDKHRDPSDQGFIKIRTIFSESITTLLQLNGFSAKKLDATEMNDLGLQILLDSHVEISSRAFNEKKVGAIDLRDLVTTLPVYVHTATGDIPVDAFLYSNYRRWCKSKATEFTHQMLVFAVAAAGGASTAPATNMCDSNIEVILIHAATKEILWANRVSSRTLITEVAAESVLEKFPKVTPTVAK